MLSSNLSPKTDANLRNAPLAFAAATAATLVGIALVWTARQAWMLAHPSLYYTVPVHLFPPAALGLAFVVARAAAGAALVLMAMKNPAFRASDRALRTSRDAPLLGCVSAPAA